MREWMEGPLSTDKIVSGLAFLALMLWVFVKVMDYLDGRSR